MMEEALLVLVGLEERLKRRGFADKKASFLLFLLLELKL